MIGSTADAPCPDAPEPPLSPAQPLWKAARIDTSKVAVYRLAGERGVAGCGEGVTEMVYLILREPAMTAGTIAAYAVLALAVALLTGYAAARIGRSGGGSQWVFFALGVFLSVVGLLIAVVYYFSNRRRPGSEAEAVPSQNAPAYYQPNYLETVAPVPPVVSIPPAEARERASKARFKICPVCGADNPASMSACWKCGESLAAASARKICPQCQAHAPAGSEFCPDCGMRLRDRGRA